MNLSPENCLTLTFVLAVIYLSIGEGQSASCDINARPHPRGLCGSRLARAHSNLCFLLSQAYPNHFPGKRLGGSDHLVHKIYSLPMSVLAELDWDGVQNRRESQNGARNDIRRSGDITDVSISNRQSELPTIKDKTRALIQMLTKRDNNTKHVAAKSQSRLVCDCCYNACTPRHLATYC